MKPKPVIIFTLRNIEIVEVAIKTHLKGGRGGRNLCDPGDVDKIPIIEIDDLFFFLD